MPKHIVSGLKYLESVELRKKGLSQKEISSQIGVDRSTISHYLNGRNISKDSIELAKTILGHWSYEMWFEIEILLYLGFWYRT